MKRSTSKTASLFALEIIDITNNYVLNFSNRTFGEFVLKAVKQEIHDTKYTTEKTSKANKLRIF